MTPASSAAAIDALEQALGPAGCITDAAQMAPHLVEWRGLFTGSAVALLSPASADEAAAAVKLCAQHGLAMVPQGGNTGLVGGGVPREVTKRPQVILSGRRLKRIRALDPDNYTLTAEAGCVLADLQKAAAEADRLFPLSLGAEGSCQLGGNIATNAGGINVLRYGNTRSLVLGLEVVLPTGEILNLLRGLRKDNTGYDLKQLFIGAEGTLGFITAATIKLFPRARSSATALVTVADPHAAVRLHAHAREALGDDVVAFELINQLAFELVTRHIPGARLPMDAQSPWYVLLEVDSVHADAGTRLQSFLEASLDAGEIADGTVAQSGQQREELWRLRHSISEAEKLAGAGIKHDIAVPLSRVPELLATATEAVTQRMPGVQVVAFGHLGDGNLHFNLNQPDGSDADAFLARWHELGEVVYDIVAELGGTFSAEHGVGILKRDDLARYRGGAELALMQTLKRAIDPGNLMNPGVLFEDA